MATLGRFQAFALDDAGNVLASPTVEVRDENTASLATLFSDRAGASGIANPFTGAADGSFSFHCTGGVYKIIVTKGAVTRTWRYVGVGTAAEHDSITDSGGNPIPVTDGGASLGTTALKWLSLFIASGGTINFNNGDLILTHSSNTLTLTGGDLVITGAKLSSRIDPRLSSAASGDITADVSTTDIVVRTALSAACAINAPTGTPVQGQRLAFRFKDNATARALSWNAIFRAVDLLIPTTTVISKTLYVGAVYNSTDTKWDVVAVNQEA